MVRSRHQINRGVATIAFGRKARQIYFPRKCRYRCHSCNQIFRRVIYVEQEMSCYQQCPICGGSQADFIDSKPWRI